MSAITVVTTFHPAGLSKYGQRFLDSFAARVDKRIKLLVYAENCKPINPDPSRIEILDAKEVLPKLVAFKEKWGHVPKANGIPPEILKHVDHVTGIKNLSGTLYALLIRHMLCMTL